MDNVNNNIKFSQLREKYPVFNYENFTININEKLIEIRYFFNINEEIYFSPEIKIFINKFYNKDNLSKELLRNFAFNIGLIELISYWKAACCPIIKIKAFYLSKEQIAWWKKLYFYGLGEFFYLNGIDTAIDDFLTIETSSNTKIDRLKVTFNDNNVILPFSGGKDSIVSLNLLKDSGKKILPFTINKSLSTSGSLKIAGYNEDEIIEIKRQIHPELLKLNQAGYLNGHTPFSALIAFYTVLVSFLTNTKHIALSNESSANEATVPGSNINHQYSKSIEFENDFRYYSNKYLLEGVNYFSLLRPLNELQIAKLFSKNDKFFSVFRSCNVGSKSNTWCGNCPKCLFAYIMLSAFIPQNRMQEIFGSDLLDNENLTSSYKELLGLSEIKPFECVGTIEEVKVASFMILNQYGNKPLPFLLKFFKENIRHSTKGNLLQNFDNDNNLLRDFIDIIMKAI